MRVSANEAPDILEMVNWVYRDELLAMAEDIE